MAVTAASTSCQASWRATTPDSSSPAVAPPLDPGSTAVGGLGRSPVVERELVGRGADVGQARDRHPEESDAGRHVHGVEQRSGHRPQGTGRIERCSDGVRPGDGDPVPVADLDGDRLPGQTGLAQTRPDGIGHAHDMAVQADVAVDVESEGLLVADGLGGPVRLHRAGVLAPGQAGQLVPVGDTDRSTQRVLRNAGQLPDGRDAEGVESSGRGGPHSPQGAHRQRVEEVQLLVGQDRRPHRGRGGGRRG